MLFVFITLQLAGIPLGSQRSPPSGLPPPGPPPPPPTSFPPPHPPVSSHPAAQLPPQHPSQPHNPPNLRRYGSGDHIHVTHIDNKDNTSDSLHDTYLVPQGYNPAPWVSTCKFVILHHRATTLHYGWVNMTFIFYITWPQPHILGE